MVKILSIVLSIVLLLVFSAPAMAAIDMSIDDLFGYHPPNYREKWIQCVDRSVQLYESCYQTEKELNAKLEKEKQFDVFLILVGTMIVHTLAVR